MHVRIIDNITPTYIYVQHTPAQKLGHGAFGIVWLAIEKESRKQVAIKKIFSCFTTKRRARRAFREAMLLSRLPGHPCLMNVLKIPMVDHNDLYLSFQLMGSDLREAIRANLIESKHRRFVILQVALALEHLHGLGVVHRDVKPSNILINERCIVKLTDFGSAMCLYSARGSMDPNSEAAMIAEMPSTISFHETSGKLDRKNLKTTSTISNMSAVPKQQHNEATRNDAGMTFCLDLCLRAAPK
jgi:serine/threonine protein kinase